ncbi:MAG: cell division ATP-binding protein FtsE [Ectothiorhodospiraceae bacterium]|nr:cell division ATP-binding protein FtsE [Chromatiales bacterium]MCP5156486.1 cell division ATP-binding protein FtsE [Ectothiorhodospiraceae bacterium]
MIELLEVTKRYPGGHEALRDVSLEVESGAMAFLTGHSGAGKSTLLRLLTRVDRPSRGHVVVAGEHLNRLSERRIPYFRRRVGVVFQDHRLLMDRSVFDNVALPLVVAHHSHHEIGRRVRAALDQVGLLDKERYRPLQLSGGEQQRVGIARAVVHTPAVVLADEPTGNLDPDLSLEVMRLFERFQQVGTTVLIASHDTALIDQMGYDVLHLERGRLVGVRRPAAG